MENKPVNAWWGPPLNFTDRKHERKISWLELFYDLVYVAAIGQLTHQIAHHPTWGNVGYAFLLFCLIFWSWVNGSQYYDLHGYDGIRTRVLTLLQMLAVAAVAITIEDAFSGHYHAFVIAFMVIQLLITYLWFSVGFYDKSHRVFNKFFTVHFLIAFALLAATLFVSHETAMWLLVLAVIFNLTPALTGANTIVGILRQHGQVFSASASLFERFGLFTIIVLAESILSVVNGVAEVKDKHPSAWIGFIIGIFITFLLWSIYFDMTSEQETKKGYSNLQYLIFLHFPLMAAFGVTGACLRTLITEIEGDVYGPVRWIFSVSLAVILLMIAGLSKIMEEREESDENIKPVTKLLIGAIAIILVLPLIQINTLIFLLLIAVILFIPVFAGIRKWIRFKFSHTAQIETAKDEKVN